MAGIEPDGAGAAAQHFVMLRDGAMAAGCLFEPALICETFLSAWTSSSGPTPHAISGWRSPG
ncbi:hypothetical protein AB0H83_47525 [Dactylosporangium sp. NPDC050688]|uniref:hypothetical protein n=1 Tax=Dactylosporangium sp. NPDC050688 TaxID=3157217 RepID=UPI0033EE4957